MRAQNNFADVLATLDYLRQHEASGSKSGVAPGTLRRIVEFLGFTLQEVFEEVRQQPATIREIPKREEARESDRTIPATPATSRAKLSSSNRGWIDDLETKEDNTAPDWFVEVEALGETTDSEALAELQRIRLLHPQKERAIVAAALSRKRAKGEIDVERVILALSKGQAVNRLRRLRRKRVAHGLQVIVDKHETMIPFARDQRDVLRTIEGLLPLEWIDVVETTGCPLSRRRDPVAYVPPRDGTTVLLLTDLGVGPVVPGRSRPHHWRGFVRLLQQRNCNVSAFVPYDLKRVPKDLRRLVAVLPWRPETTSREVGHLIANVDRKQNS